MQVPPGPGQPFFITKPIYEWINRINKVYLEFEGLHLSPEQKARLSGWIESEFVESTLRLERRNRSIPGAERAPSDVEITSPAGDTLAEQARVALRRIIAAVDSSPMTPLSLELLIELSGGGPTGDTIRGWAESEGTSEAEIMRARAASICAWTEADSFSELNPVEQAALIHLRLSDVQPFERGNDRIARSAASLFTVRAGLPPIIVDENSVASYRAALAEGRKMNTRPMVEVLAETTERSLSEMIRIARG